MSATLEIVIPDTVREFLEACESGEPWVLTVFVLPRRRRFRRTPQAWVEAGAAEVQWDRPPAAPGHYVGKASVEIVEAGRVAPRAMLRGPLGALPLEWDGGGGYYVRPASPPSHEADRIEVVSIRLTVM